MPALTLKLDRLVELFARSVNNDKLPVETRSFAAKLMTLTAHVIRIDNSAGKAFATVNKQLIDANTQITQLTEIVMVLAAKLGIEVPAPTAAPQAAAPATPAPNTDQPRPATPAAKPPAPAQAAPVVEEVDEDEEAAVAKLLAETQAEVDAINNSNGAVTQ